MSDSEDDLGLPAEELERIEKKIRDLPTLEALLKEKSLNERSESELREVSVFVQEILDAEPQGEDEIVKLLSVLRKKHKKVYQKSHLLAGYRFLQRKSAEQATVAGKCVDVEDLSSLLSPANPAGSSSHHPPLKPASRVFNPYLESYLVSKSPRSQSGVLVVTVFTSPYPDGKKFSCEWNCYYCPNEPGQPRSYLLNEPGVRRANRMAFDPVRQFNERVTSLHAIGHPVDKVELLVLGGTWESYPVLYRERFIRDIYYAANTFFQHPSGPRRSRLSMWEEQQLNESAACKIIGLTLETRPDTIQLPMLVELRRLGCTRVQLGVQHTDDGILAGVNRQATREDTARAIKLLKDSAFKVDIHLMPDLPGATPEADKQMFDDVLSSPDLQADQWKIYPCQTTPFTVIEEWYRQGKYKPYGLKPLLDVIVYAKRRVHPWIRLNRVIRDIPVEYVLAGVEVSNLRQLLCRQLESEGTPCRCIRCREIKGDKEVGKRVEEAVLVERSYAASHGTEIFLSFETPAPSETLLGFLRLRVDIKDGESPFPELSGCALIRELHVYGNLVTTQGKSTRPESMHTQHLGFGSRLLEKAESIAKEKGYKRIAVISGIGVRGYYRRRGFVLRAAQRGGYLIKQLVPEDPSPLVSSNAPSAMELHRPPPLFLPYRSPSSSQVERKESGSSTGSPTYGKRLRAMGSWLLSRIKKKRFKREEEERQ